MRVVSASLPESMVDEVDELAQEQGYSGRSEVFRAALRAFLAKTREEAQYEGEVTATLTLSYVEDAGEEINRRRHRHDPVIKTMMHDHTEEHGCLEVLVLEGRAEGIRSLADDLRGRQGVRSVELVWLPPVDSKTHVHS